MNAENFLLNFILKDECNLFHNNVTNIFDMLNVFLEKIDFENIDESFVCIVLLSFEDCFENFRNDFFSSNIQEYLTHIRNSSVPKYIKRIYSIAFEIIWILKRYPSHRISSPWNHSGIMIHHVIQYFRTNRMNSEYLDYSQTELLQKCDELHLILYDITYFYREGLITMMYGLSFNDVCQNECRYINNELIKREVCSFI